MQNLKTELNIQNLTLMYVGNLESYQGIDLLLESFALVVNQTAQADLVIIGGDSADILKYQIVKIVLNQLESSKHLKLQIILHNSIY